MVEIPATRASLLVRLRDAHDDAAWTEFVHLYAPLIYRYARKQGLQDADAADFGQEVLGVIANSIGRLEYDPRRGSFRGWLFTVVRRRLLNWRAARRNLPSACGDGALNRLLQQQPEPKGEAEEWRAEWERRLFSWACEQVRRDVSATTWQAFWRTAVDGQDGKRVAAELGLSVTAVYLSRHRVLVRLKELVRSVQEE